MSENPEISVHKNETEGQYEILVGEEVAGFATYADANGVRDLPHTVVDPKFRGQGLSKPLIQAALDDARADDMLVTPSCPAVERYIEQNPQYRDLLA